jgi:phospholipid/cholesterol/gamma-HCH transport system ATP-binding protein
MALDPSIIMYDEPFAGQDPISMSVLVNLINLLNKFSKITTVIVSHDINETFEIADYVYILNERRIVAEGTPDIIRNCRNNFIQSFVNIKMNCFDTCRFLADGYEKSLLFD